LYLPQFRHGFDAASRKSRQRGDRIFCHIFDRGVIRHVATTQDFEVNKGFQTSARRTLAERQANAYVTFWTACALTLATLITVATVSIEVVKAAALH
jgi:hypothetical protein